VNNIYTGFTMLKFIGTDRSDVDKPSAAAMESLNDEATKVAELVKQYLNAQALKILPGPQFVDAVKQFVEKKDIHAMESFIGESLEAQFNEIMGLEEEEEDLDPAMEASRARREALFVEGTGNTVKKIAKLKPTPEDWDSEDGRWSEQPGAYEYTSGREAEANELPAPKKKRGKAAAKSDDDESIVSAPVKKAPAKRATAKKPAAKAPTKAKAMAKAPKKTTAKGKNKGFELSDDEDEDVMMLDEAPPAPKTMPKRAAAKRGVRSTQTQLNFGQSQSQAKTQTARELSDDIIELDDSDAFEPVASSSKRR